MESQFYCVDCKQTKPTQTTGGTGYAQGINGDIVCYACCAIRDRATMLETGRITLYLSHHCAINWPGTLSFPVGEVKHSWHNFAGRDGRTDVWFRGPDSAMWHGVNIGDNQLLRCKRTKG